MPDRTQRQPLAHTLMFWLLAGMGVIAAVPCFVVLPIEAYKKLLEAEQQEQIAVRRLEEHIAHQAVLQEALRSDPQVNVRLAQRELGYRQLGEVAYLPPPAGAIASQPNRAWAQAAEVELPTWMAKLYPQRWSSIYRRRDTRHVVLFMSLALILFALVAYGRLPRAPQYECSSDNDTRH